MERSNENYKHPELISLWDDDVDNRYQKIVDYCAGTECEEAAKQLQQLINEHGSKKADAVPGGITEQIGRISGQVTYFAYYGEMPQR